jgi:hypothetical protein
LIERHVRKMRRKVRKRIRDTFRGAAERWCPECQKRVQPFHICAPSSDFKSRRRQAERRDSRRKRASGKSRERSAHQYQTCTDQSCTRPVCVAFREGMAACPLEHVLRRVPMSGVIVIGLVAAAVYYVSLRIHPHTYCRRCQGGGRNAGSTRQRFGFCKRCGGSGRKPRFGTRFLR